MAGRSPDRWNRLDTGDVQRKFEVVDFHVTCQPALALQIDMRRAHSMGNECGAVLSFSALQQDRALGKLISGQADVALSYASARHLPLPPHRFETAVLGRDKLIAVAHPELDTATARPPLIAFPSEVFGHHDRDHPARKPTHRKDLMAQRVETPLASAALDLARRGAGIAWVPQTMAARDLAEGRLKRQIDLRETWLWITAVRPRGTRGLLAQRVWNTLFSFGLGQIMPRAPEGARSLN